jgi:hypothetical protein
VKQGFANAVLGTSMFMPLANKFDGSLPQKKKNLFGENFHFTKVAI